MKKFENLLLLALWLLAAVAHAGTVTYVYTDPQGTPLAEANASGTITARFDYAPYGQSVTSMGAAPNGPGYTGHVNDSDTGLVYMQARYYDPGVGRFLSVDPMGPASGNGFNFSRYTYANNNPIVNVDPDGKFPLPPLFRLDWFHSVIRDSVDEQVTPINQEIVQPMSNAISTIDSEQVATALDTYQVGADVAAIFVQEPRVGAVLVLSGEMAAVAACYINCTTERKLGLVTLGGLKVLSVATKGYDAAKTVGVAEKAATSTEVLTWVQDHTRSGKSSSSPPPPPPPPKSEQKHPNDHWIFN